MSLKERLKMIDEFFDNLTIEEFEDVAIECGINEIKPSSHFGMELVSADLVSYLQEEKYSFKESMQEFEPNDILVEAV